MLLVPMKIQSGWDHGGPYDCYLFIINYGTYGSEQLTNLDRYQCPDGELHTLVGTGLRGP